MAKAIIHVYLKNGGAKYSYTVEEKTAEELGAKVRQHMGAIFADGYRHCSGGNLEWFGPHWIDKITAVGDIETKYPDAASGT